MYVIKEIKKDFVKHLTILCILLALYFLPQYMRVSFDKAAVGTPVYMGNSIDMAQAWLVLFTLIFVGVSSSLMGTLRQFLSSSRIEYETTNGNYLITITSIAIFIYIGQQFIWLNRASIILLLSLILGYVIRYVIFRIKRVRGKLYFEFISFLTALCVGVMLVLSHSFSIFRFSEYGEVTLTKTYTLVILVTAIIIMVSYRRFNFLMLSIENENNTDSLVSVKLREGSEIIISFLQIFLTFQFGVFLFLDMIATSLSYKYKKYFFPYIIYSSVIAVEVLLMCTDVVQILHLNYITVTLLVLLFGILFSIFSGFFNYFNPYRSNR